MSLASRAGDLYYTFRFVKLLTTPWDETDAYKLGIIDENGKRIKSKSISTSEEKDAYTTFHRLVYNIKRLINRLPGGSSKIASYASAFFLLKEHLGLSDASVEKIISKMELDVNDFIAEKTEWYLLENKQLAQGIYRVKEEKLIASSCDDIVNANDRIKVYEDCFPVGEILGMDVYKATHLNTNQPVYITLGEIYK
jgi:hypothetical protein